MDRSPAAAVEHPKSDRLLADARHSPKERIWVKPAGHQKRFVCGLMEADALASLETPAWCAQPVRWLCEWRHYVVGGHIRWGERYDPNGDDDAPHPDQGEVDAMVAAYEASGSAPAGYGLDVGVLDSGETALIEVNDGYALGFYGAVTLQRAEEYLSLLDARFSELVRPTTAAPQ